MDKKKFIIVIVIAIIVVLAIIFSVYKIYTSYLFRESDGKIVDGKTELIEHLKSIENEEERKNQIDFSVEHNAITQEEANTLY